LSANSEDCNTNEGGSDNSGFIADEIKVAAIAVLENFVNSLTQLSPLPESHRLTLNNKVIGIEITDLHFQIFILFHEDNIDLSENFRGDVNTQIKMNVHTLFELAKHRGSTPSNIKMEIHGEIEAGQAFKSLLDEYEFDWEEQLSKITGDVIANKIGQGARKLTHWLKTNFENSSQAGADYLIEEKHFLPHPVEVNEFITKVDIIRNDVDRLHARINRLLTKTRA